MPDSQTPNQPVKEEELDPRTRAQARKALHEQREKERAEKAEQLKADYQKIKEEPAVQDILHKARAFRAYHQKLASDGVGAKVVSDPDAQSGQRVIEYELTDSQVFRELGSVSALDQLLTYIENKLA